MGAEGGADAARKTKVLRRSPAPGAPGSRPPPGRRNGVPPKQLEPQPYAVPRRHRRPRRVTLPARPGRRLMERPVPHVARAVRTEPRATQAHALVQPLGPQQAPHARPLAAKVARVAAARPRSPAVLRPQPAPDADASARHALLQHQRRAAHHQRNHQTPPPRPSSVPRHSLPLHPPPGPWAPPLGPPALSPRALWLGSNLSGRLRPRGTLPPAASECPSQPLSLLLSRAFPFSESDGLWCVSLPSLRLWHPLCAPFLSL